MQITVNKGVEREGPINEIQEPFSPQALLLDELVSQALPSQKARTFECWSDQRGQYHLKHVKSKEVEHKLEPPEMVAKQSSSSSQLLISEDLWLRLLNEGGSFGLIGLLLLIPPSIQSSEQVGVSRRSPLLSFLCDGKHQKKVRGEKKERQKTKYKKQNFGSQPDTCLYSSPLKLVTQISF